jgi:hypothetical protein
MGILDSITGLWRQSRARHEMEAMGLSADDQAAVQEALRRGDEEAATAVIARSQERRRRAIEAATGMDVRGLVPCVGTHISWADVYRQVFRVLELDRAGTTVGRDGKVHARTHTDPYGFLLVDSPILNSRVKLPITHRDDFLLATRVFDEPEAVRQLGKEFELLVTYAPKRVIAGGLSGSVRHSLHYVVTPCGTLERYYGVSNSLHMAKPAPEKLFGQFTYEGEVSVQVNADPKI